MERVWSTSRGGFSVRSILTFVLTVFITALLWATFGNQPLTHAVADAPLTWKGETILYNGHQYFSAGDVASGDSVGLPVGTHYYLYTPDNSSSQPTASQKAFVIYFAPGTDPPTEKTATLVTYDYSSDKVFSHPTDKLAITATPKGEDNNDISSCTIQGIGWIICPITTFLADGMDHIFDIIKGFLVVQPANTTNTGNSLYIAWDTMRSVANVAFIIVFLIIIYSQLTNAGVSNYGLKKLLPRLIVAAVLVNLSYFICAIAVDISNILGYSLQDIFVSIRKDTFNISNDTWANSTGMGWSAIAAIVLSGGAATAGFIIVAGAGTAAAIYLLLPALVGLLLTALIVVVILAARQAIIIILIVVAPLAFVAYLLPNTEQWFKKWRDLFMTMLVFFPAFSLIFGGSQLAGGLIIQNSTAANGITSIIGVIFGMAVQVAPLAISPLVLKLSGSLLGRIGGMLSDPRKKLVDRTRAWSAPRAERSRLNSINKPMKRRNVLRRSARRLAYNTHKVEQQTAEAKAGFEAYATRRDIGSRSGQRTAVNTALHKLESEELNNNLSQAVQELRAGDSSGLDRLRLLGEETTLERIRIRASGGTTTLEDLRITSRQGTRRNEGQAKFAAAVTARAVELDQSSRIIANATASAQGAQQQRFAKAIDASADLQVMAGGIDPNGAQRALANAFAVMSKAREETISNAGKIIDYRNLSNAQIEELSEGRVPVGVNIQLTQDIRAASLKRTLGGADTEQLAKAMQNIDFSFAGLSEGDRKELQIIAGATLEANAARPPEWGAGSVGLMKQGLAYNGAAFAGPLGVGGTQTMIINALNEGKIDAGKLQGAGKDYTQAIFNVLSSPTQMSRITPAARNRLKGEVATVLDPTREASERLGNSKPFLEGIDALL